MVQWEGAMEGVGINMDFWKGKRILITGHTGFKGGWLSFWLHKKGASVIGYSLPDENTNKSFFNSVNVSAEMTNIYGDIRDIERLNNAIKEYKPEIVFHTAAQSLVRYSYIHPVETYSTNIMGTVNLLETIRRNKGVKVVVIVTSDKCYKNNEWLWGYRENDALGGKDPYSSSKGCAEIVTAAYQESFFPQSDYLSHEVAIATVRAGNVIGGGDWAKDRLVPDIINALINKTGLIIRSPGAIRPWQHVMDALNGYLVLARKLWEFGPKYSGGWNFGPNDEDVRTVQEVVQLIHKLWGTDAQWEMDGENVFPESNILKLDCSKSRGLLRWKPRLNFEIALKLTVDWYRAQEKREDMRGITEIQISRFENS